MQEEAAALGLSVQAGAATQAFLEETACEIMNAGEPQTMFSLRGLYNVVLTSHGYSAGYILKFRRSLLQRMIEPPSKAACYGGHQPLQWLELLSVKVATAALTCCM